MPTMTEARSPAFELVLASAARLQSLVPDAVLVGGTAASIHAGHRVSFDHDHVVHDLADRFDTVLDHLEALGEWSTARVRPGKIILGSLDIAALAHHIGIERAGHVLARIDEYYADVHPGPDRVATQVARQLGRPLPRDEQTTRELHAYKNLAERWHQWTAVVDTCRKVGVAMLDEPGGS